MASAQRLQVLATQAAPDMAAGVAGYLYLKSGNAHGESLCCWRSQTTSLTTPWHGGWSEDEAGGIYARFDYLGRDNRKFCQLDSDGNGFDYEGRAIRAVLHRTWLFDVGTATYLDHPGQRALSQ